MSNTTARIVINDEAIEARTEELANNQEEFAGLTVDCVAFEQLINDRISEGSAASTGEAEDEIFENAAEYIGSVFQQ